MASKKEQLHVYLIDDGVTKTLEPGDFLYMTVGVDATMPNAEIHSRRVLTFLWDGRGLRQVS